MKVVYKTDVGKIRTHNEDSILVDESMNIFLLADGMGGHQAGEVASEQAVKESYTWLKDNLNKTRSEADISALLTESFLKAHHAIKTKSMTDINLLGMGTTLLLMLVSKNNAHICHVGDSRAYLFRKGIKQITKDHTSEMYFVKKNAMAGNCLPLQKMRVLTQAVGNSESLVPETRHEILKAEDIFLLCTDGLSDMLSGKEIESIIQKHKDNLSVVADNLIQEANNKGGIDNISVILIKV